MKPIGCILMFVALAAATGYAQQPLLSVQVPFPFSAGDISLPAGTYAIASGGALGNLYWLLRADGRPVTSLMTGSVQSKGSYGARLIFNKYGETYFLTEMYFYGNPVGRRLFPTKREREMMAQAKGSRLAVAARAKPKS